MKSKHLCAAAAALLAMALPAVAQPVPAAGQGPVETRLEARKVVPGADGRESFVAAEAARPGEVIEYVATYRNTGRQPVRDLQATLPIPANTELVAGSPVPAGAKASLDGRAYADTPLKRRVRRDGREAEVEVPLREYRSLRWYQRELAPNQSVTFTARVKVLDDASSGEPAARGGAR